MGVDEGIAQVLEHLVAQNLEQNGIGILQSVPQAHTVRVPVDPHSFGGRQWGRVDHGLEDRVVSHQQVGLKIPL
jgi:hypothetical protein